MVVAAAVSTHNTGEYMSTSETVNGAKTKTAPAADAGTVAEPVAPRKTLTNWRVFGEAGFVPSRFRCEGYLQSHPSDLTCKSNVLTNGENVARHVNPEHGGGWFKVRFRISDSGKFHPLWKELEEQGIELTHFWCPHCREDVPVSPRRIVYHLNNHPGAMRVNLEPQTLCMSLSFQRPDAQDMESLYTD